MIAKQKAAVVARIANKFKEKVMLKSKQVLHFWKVLEHQCTVGLGCAPEAAQAA